MTTVIDKSANRSRTLTNMITVTLAAWKSLDAQCLLIVIGANDPGVINAESYIKVSRLELRNHNRSVKGWARTFLQDSLELHQCETTLSYYRETCPWCRCNCTPRDTPNTWRNHCGWVSELLQQEPPLQVILIKHNILAIKWLYGTVMMYSHLCHSWLSTSRLAMGRWMQHNGNGFLMTNRRISSYVESSMSVVDSGVIV